MIAYTTNVVCGGTTDEVVSHIVTVEGWAVGVGSDAHVLELRMDLLSPGSENAAVMLYSGVLIDEV